MERKDIDIGPTKQVAKFVGAAKVGEIRNPKGRPKGTGMRIPLPARLAKMTKASLFEIFGRSHASAIVDCYLNMRIPPQLKPSYLHPGKTKITPQQDAAIKAELQRNFKWAFDQIGKMMPKEIGHFGSVNHSVKISEAVKRATTEDKSDKVIDLVKKRREKELYEVGEN